MVNFENNLRQNLIKIFTKMHQNAPNCTIFFFNILGRACPRTPLEKDVFFSKPEKKYSWSP